MKKLKFILLLNAVAIMNSFSLNAQLLPPVISTPTTNPTFFDSYPIQIGCEVCGQPGDSCSYRLQISTSMLSYDPVDGLAFVVINNGIPENTTSIDLPVNASGLMRTNYIWGEELSDGIGFVPQPSTTYYYTMRCSCNGVTSNYSPLQSFTTGEWSTTPFEVDGFTYRGSRAQNGEVFRYYISDNPMTWQEAKTETFARGGYLAYPNDQAEQIYINNLGDEKLLWCGLTDEATEGVFLNVFGEPAPYLEWAANEPNNCCANLIYQGQDLGEEDYVHIWGVNTHKMNDQLNYNPYQSPFYAILKIKVCSDADAYAFKAKQNVKFENGVLRKKRDVSIINDWNSGGRSTEKLAANVDGFIEFEVGQDNKALAVGFATANTTNAWEDLSYGFFFKVNITYAIVESGSQILTQIPYLAGDVFRIVKRNGIISYYQNDLLIYTSQTSVSSNLFFDVAFKIKDAAIKSIASSFFGCTAPSVPPVSPREIVSVNIKEDYEKILNEINIFPNPANEFLNIQSPSSIKKIEITDAMGRMIEEIDFDLETEIQLNIQGLETGSYILKIITENGITIQKILKM